MPEFAHGHGHHVRKRHPFRRDAHRGRRRQEPVLASLFASIYNKTIIETNVGQDAAALGAAAVAAVGCGLWDSYDRVRDVHERRGAIAPDPADNAVYEALLPVFSKICDIQSDIGDMLQSLELPAAEPARRRLGGPFSIPKEPAAQKRPLARGGVFAV